MPNAFHLCDFLPTAADGLFSALIDQTPWEITSRAADIIRNSQGALTGFSIHDGVAVHRKATIESGAVVKSPAIIGPGAFVAATAYLDGGVFLDEGCIVGPACEVKATFMLKGSKIAHLTFAGDSIIGAGAAIESGAILANYRNEWADNRIRILWDGAVIDTGVQKFGALIGEGARVGAGAVIAPGALIRPGEIVPRQALVDQAPQLLRGSREGN